jgi:kynurenine formamidase
MQIIDLSMPIRSHWRWTFNSEQTLDRKKGAPYQSTTFTMSAHAYTHIDSPLHIEPDRMPIDAVPLNSLTGPAVIIDLSYVQPNQAIQIPDLEKNADEIIPGDIAVLKTAWDLKHSWTDREYWTEAPYLDEEAAAWLSNQDLNAVGFDFPQDYVTREIPDRHPSVQEMPAHDLILRKGIYQIEYLCNVHQINAKRVTLIALPLKLAGCEGAPARVIALLD